MELKEEFVRIEVCEQCNQHDKLNSHSQQIYQNAFYTCKKLLNDHGFNVIKNVPFKYMMKTKDNKLSTKRYMDQNTHKILEFPRKGSFQIYYMNILVFSKLQTGDFPDNQLLLTILEKIKHSSRINPLLESFDLFRDIEFEWKKNENVLNSVYGYINQSCPRNPIESEIDQAFLKLQKTKIERKKKKIIYPYSFYNPREKQCKMQKIYCPSLLDRSKKQGKSYKNIGQKMLQVKKRPLTSTGKYKIMNKNELFNMVRLGGEKSINENRIKGLKHDDLKNPKFRSKNLYFSYLNQVRDSKDEVKSRNLKLKTEDIPKRSSGDSTQRIFQSKIISSLQSSSRKSSDYTNKIIQKFEEEIKQEKVSMKNIMIQSEKKEENPDDVKIKDSVKTEEKSPQMKSIIKDQMKNIIDNFEVQIEDKQNLKQSSSSIKIEENVEEQKKQQTVLKEDTLEQMWQINQLEAHLPYEAASITKKFSQNQNFSLSIFKNQYKKQKSKLTAFNIEGFELAHNFKVESLRRHHKPNQIKLFPEIFKLIQGRFLKLAFAVNLLLKQNPLLISRIFQNKKFVNPFGIYCIWLREKDGNFSPIIINDDIAFNTHNEPIYSKISSQNSIWFMLLEKAIAKVLGGYHKIEQMTLSQLLSMILNCPKIQFKQLSPDKMEKILTEKIFFNRLCYLYTISIDNLIGKSDNFNEIRRILDFQKVPSGLKDSLIIMEKGTGSKQSLTLREFLLFYNFLSLLFFNSNFSFNQLKLPFADKSRLITFQLRNNSKKNDCYLIMNNFPTQTTTKVTIFKKLTDEEAKITDGMNPLEEEQRKYEYIGEICKKQHFFFETQLQIGQYICLLQTRYESKSDLHVSIYSEKTITIHEVKVHPLPAIKKEKQPIFIKQSRRKVKKKQPQESPPKVLFEKNLSTCKTEVKFKPNKKGDKEICMKKRFMDSDDEDQGMKQNIQ